jgi:basic membrane protein A and related proteins
VIRTLPSVRSALPWFLAVGVAVGTLLVPARRQLTVVGAAPALSANAVRRVALVFDVGGRGDKSFNDAAYAGIVRAEQSLPVQITYVEPSSSEDRESALRLFAARGYDLILGIGFIFSSDIDVVAQDYPRLKFGCIDYFARGPIPPNVAALAFREEEGSFLVGALAGLTSLTHKVGFVGGMTGPLIRRFEVGYAAGVHAVCKECVVESAYVGATPEAYHDPARGKALAAAQFQNGVDTVYHASGATGHGIFEAAREANARAIGVDSDQHDEMPGVVLSSMIKRVDVAVFETIASVVADKFVGGTRVFGLRDNGVDYVHEGEHARAIAPAVRARIAELREDVIAGRVVVPNK